MKIRLLAGSMLLVCACSGSMAPSSVLQSQDDGPVVVVPPSLGAAAWEKDRAATWADVDRLVDEQKYQSALQIVEEIVTAARQQGDAPEQVRALIRRVGLEISLNRNEDAVNHLIGSVETWPQDLVSRTLLGLYLAESLNQYKGFYSWEINQRPTREDADLKDVRTWSADQISDRVMSILFELWSWRDALVDVRIETVKEFVRPDTYPDKVRGTLADSVAYMLADKLADSSLWTPAESNGLWRLDIEKLMAPAARAPLSAPPAENHPLETLSLILRDHQALKESRGLTDSAFDARLVLTNTLSSHSGSLPAWNTYLIEWLTKRLAVKPDFDWWAEGMYVLADMTRNVDKDDSQIHARRIALECVKGRPGSDGASRCRNLVTQIEARQIGSLSSRANARPGQEFISVSVRNVDHLWFKAWKVDYGKALSGPKVRDPQNAIIESFRNTTSLQKPDLTWDIAVTDPGNFRDHTLRLAPPIKEKGAWVIQLSANREFSKEDNVIQNILVYLDGPIVVTEFDQSRQDRTIRVLDGEFGSPIAGARIRLFSVSWQRGEAALNKLADAVTDQFGEARIKINEVNGRRILGVVDQGGLTWPMNTPYNFGNVWRYGVTKRQTLIYTDRSIYRPGQKILFKVQEFTRNSDTDVPWSPVDGANAIVELRDANYEVVASKRVKTNAWGSGSDEFEIPQGKMLGAWSIQVNQSASTMVRIEEYRVPSFTVEVDSPEGLRLNSRAVVSGKADYFFGLPVSGGRVSWKVQRQERWPWWCWYRQARTEVIATGVEQTDDKGVFKVDFLAEAGEKPQGDDIPEFVFVVDVDVTDEAGETHSTSRAFNMGWAAVKALASTQKGFFDAGKPVDVSVSRMDLNGNPAPGKVDWKLFRIADPEKPQLPSDVQNAPVGFPGFRGDFDSYYDRTNSYSPDEMVRMRPDGARRAAGTLDVGDGGSADLTLGALENGFWRLRYTVKDQYGQSWSGSFDFNVVSPTAPTTLPILLKAQADSYEVGDTIRLAVGSAFKGQHAILNVSDRSGLVETRRLKLGSGTEIINYKVNRAARGGLQFNLMAYRDYQNLSQVVHVSVPWSDRLLKVSIDKFRDKVTPGGRETISFRVADPSGRPVPAAEVLAWMYDRSLDDLAPLSVPDMMRLWPGIQYRINISDNLTMASGLYTQHDGFKVKYVSVVSYEPDGLVYLDVWRRHWGRRDIGYAQTMMTGGAGRMTASAPAPINQVMSDSAEQEDGLVRTKAAKAAEAAPSVAANGPTNQDGDKAAPAQAGTDVRSNFAETAFFMPHLLTGVDGVTTLEYEVPDSITTWKVLASASTKDMRSGRTEGRVISSRDLMVKPFLPRFMREGDVVVVTAVVANTTDRELSGSVSIRIEDSVTGADVTSSFEPDRKEANFSSPPKGDTTVYFKVKAPSKPGSVSFRIVARSDSLSDGELRPVPILPGRYHLAQSRFVTLRGKDGKDARTVEFKDMNDKDPTRVNEKLVVTVDGQLFMSILSALPYLTEYPYECAEQTLNRFVSTGIVSSLFDRYPGVAAMAKRAADARDTQFEAWDRKDPNRKLALEETPWLRESTGEGSSRFFKVLDPAVAKRTKDDALAKLEKMQHDDGAFPWFPGGPPSQWMTLYVVAGMSRAMEFGVEIPTGMVSNAMSWTHEWFLRMKREHPDWVKNDWGNATFLGWVLSNLPQEMWGGFTTQEQAELLKLSFENWKKMSVGMKSMLAMTLHRAKRTADAQLVWDSVMDAARTEKDRGMFWAPEDRSWLWYNDTIENHARAVRTLEEIDPDSNAIDELVLWLFINKKLNHWKSTRATAEVLYALAHHLAAQNELGVREIIDVKAGDRTARFDFDPLKSGETRGQMVIDGPDVDESEMSTVSFTKETPGWALASATWHFSTEKLPEEGDGDLLKIDRKYFLKKKTTSGPVLEPITESTAVSPGDEVEVQISIRSGEPVEYVHLRDPRPAGFEPVKSVSGYNWNFGISWYEEVRDSGENFFFESLPRGEYTFRYSIRAALAGDFKAAPATIQPMYAPEFAAYSAGRIISIEPRQE